MDIKAMIYFKAKMTLKCCQPICCNGYLLVVIIVRGKNLKTFFIPD